MASNVGRAGLRAEDSVEIHGCVVDATRPGEAWERLVAYSAHRYPASALHDGGDGAPPGKVRWVFLSDTCGLHHAMADVPNGDVLVHCGNFSTTGSVERTREFVEWFAGHPHRRKVLVAGNQEGRSAGSRTSGLTRARRSTWPWSRDSASESRERPLFGTVRRDHGHPRVRFLCERKVATFRVLSQHAFEVLAAHCALLSAARDVRRTLL